MNGDWSFDKWLTRYKITTRVLVTTGVWMNIHAYLWGTRFAASSPLSGTEIAAIIAVVQGIATSYIVLVYKIYQENKTL